MRTSVQPGVTNVRSLARAYLLAKERVVASGFEDEIAWQETVAIENVTPRAFVREAAWVILCAGMRESIIRARFEALGAAFARWEPDEIAATPALCARHALRVFNHRPKVRAIGYVASEVVRLGIDQVLRGLQREGPRFMTKFPYIGPVTCFHLAKNLGYPVAKPDRHLQRMAEILGFAGAMDLCTAIADVLAEPVQVVDVVMWRYATINPYYLAWLSESVSSGGAGEPAYLA